MAREAFRSFISATGLIPIETVGVRRSGRQPGERLFTVITGNKPNPATLYAHLEQPRVRHLQLVKSGEPETVPQSPSTLRGIVDNYLQVRFTLRNQGLFVGATHNTPEYMRDVGGHERADKPLADAIHNDLPALDYVIDKPVSILEVPHGVVDAMKNADEFTNPEKLRHVFTVYAFKELSPKIQRKELDQTERMVIYSEERGVPEDLRVIMLSEAEVETVRALLQLVGVNFDVPEGKFEIPETILLKKMREELGARLDYTLVRRQTRKLLTQHPEDYY